VDTKRCVSGPVPRFVSVFDAPMTEDRGPPSAGSPPTGHSAAGSPARSLLARSLLARTSAGPYLPRPAPRAPEARARCRSAPSKGTDVRLEAAGSLLLSVGGPPPHTEGGSGQKRAEVRLASVSLPVVAPSPRRLRQHSNLVERGRHDPAVDTSWRPLICGSETGATDNDLALDIDGDWRGQRVRLAEQGRPVEEATIVTCDRRFGETLVATVVGVIGQEGESFVHLRRYLGKHVWGRRRRCQPADDSAHGFPNLASRRSAFVDGLLAEPGQTATQAEAGGLLWSVTWLNWSVTWLDWSVAWLDWSVGWLDRFGVSSRHPSSTSTSRGAWSEGSFPLRALRSTSAQVTPAASGRESSTRSIRIPRCS
jgi:hypothetical protein